MMMLASMMSMIRIAIILNVQQHTIANKLMFLANQSRKALANQYKAGLSRSDKFQKSELLPNAQDVQFLAQRSIAELCKLCENCADWVFRDSAKVYTDLMN